MLSQEFVTGYASRRPEFGFASGPNSIGELTFYRTYARVKPDGSKERWHETVARVVNGCYQIQKAHCLNNNRPWNEDKARRSAEVMYDKIFNFKFLPPGRGIWMAGTDYVRTRGAAALNNCAFVSTAAEHGGIGDAAPWLMDMSMLGVGVGFDTRGAGQRVYQPLQDCETFVIPDSREGWVESLRMLLNSYLMKNSKCVQFDYSKIRPKGAPIKGFGGVAEGPEPLQTLHEQVRDVLFGLDRLSVRAIVDIMNMVGQCVVAGNVRRSAEIALGSWDSDEFVNLKNYEQNPDRAAYGWVSNNSVYAKLGMDYEAIGEAIARNGEPGLIYPEVMQTQGRIGEYKHDPGIGVNPCAEQILEHKELCTLVEVMPANHDSFEELQETLKYAYLYAKSVTLAATHDAETNKVMAKNRRIGTSMTGIVQFIKQHGEATLAAWLDEGYAYVQQVDDLYSEWLGVPNSVRTTTVKPSGTVSLLSGSTPGVHYPEFDYYIRRIRFAEGSDLLRKLQEAGYHSEPDQYSANTWVVEFPVAGEGLPTADKVSVRDKAWLATFMAKHWSDNAVSCTITFKPEESAEIPAILEANEGKWKTVSFLPMLEKGAFAQMPYEAITRERYEASIAGLQRVDLYDEMEVEAPIGEIFCTTDYCEIKTFQLNA